MTDKETVSRLLNAVVLSSKGGVPESRLNRDYNLLIKESIPYSRLGYRSLDAFLCDVPTIHRVGSTYQGIAVRETAHLAKLVAGQCSQKMWRGPLVAGQMMGQSYPFVTTTTQAPPTGWDWDELFGTWLQRVSSTRCSLCDGSMPHSRYVCSICMCALCVDCGQHWAVLHEHCLSSRVKVTLAHNYKGLSGASGRAYSLQRRDCARDLPGSRPDDPINVNTRSSLASKDSVNRVNEEQEEYYGKLENRLATFDDYTTCNSNSQNPLNLAAAGFIYMGPEGGTRCYKCGCQDWLASENPFDIHAALSPSCEFVLENIPRKVAITGDQFVDDGSFQMVLLKEKRGYGMLQDTMDTHLCIAKSQYYSLVEHNAGSLGYQLDYVEYIHNPKLEKRFTKQAKYESEDEQNYILAFHGTPAHNIDSIARNNFDRNRAVRKAYGEGIYFSEFPDVSMPYTAGSMCLLLCKILPGHCETYPPKSSHYDSVKVDRHGALGRVQGPVLQGQLLQGPVLQHPVLQYPVLQPYNLQRPITNMGAMVRQQRPPPVANMGAMVHQQRPPPVANRAEVCDDLGRGWAVVINQNMDQILPYCVLHLKR